MSPTAHAGVLTFAKPLGRSRRHLNPEVLPRHLWTTPPMSPSLDRSTVRRDEGSGSTTEACGDRQSLARPLCAGPLGGRSCTPPSPKSSRSHVRGRRPAPPAMTSARRTPKSAIASLSSGSRSMRAARSTAPRAARPGHPHPGGSSGAPARTGWRRVQASTKALQW